MNCFADGVSRRLLAGLAFACAMGSSQAQPASCSSDGQPRPAALLERFINADCSACWNDAATPAAQPAQAALDWVVPGARGEDAPLSAVASTDGLQRAAALGLEVPTTAHARRRVGGPATLALRVAHGVALAGYIGVSIQAKGLPARRAPRPFTAWLALVETLPAGTEGSPVERNLARNLLQATWDGRRVLSKGERRDIYESRVMHIGEGVRAERLGVIGWLEDADGRLLGVARSACPLQHKK